MTCHQNEVKFKEGCLHKGLTQQQADQLQERVNKLKHNIEQYESELVTLRARSKAASASRRSSFRACSSSRVSSSRFTAVSRSWLNCSSSSVISSRRSARS